MKPTLSAGATASHIYTVTVANTVPHLAMDRSTFDDIPEVLATAYLVVMLEGAATKALRPHLDANEGSVGVSIKGGLSDSPYWMMVRPGLLGPVIPFEAC